MKAGIVAGRVLMSLIFIGAGLEKIGGWRHTAEMMAAKGLPVVPVLLALTILLEVGGGLALLTGIRARLGALALCLFLIPATYVFHNFWAVAGAEHQLQMVNFMKNLAIMGGLLVVASSRGSGEDG